MSLLDYINGRKKGKDAHDLEKKAMRDPFLFEALDGFDTVDGDHMAHMEAIRNKIKGRRTRQNGRSLWNTITAAAVVIVIGLASSLFLLQDQQHSMYAENDIQYPIDLYLPDNIYEDNIMVIAYKNTELTKNISVIVSDSKADELKIKKEENEELGEQIEIETIDIIFPNGKKD